MNKKKRIMILDVEGLSTCRPYNIGWIIGDKHGNIYSEESMAILPCIWENLKNCFCAKEMTHKNVEEILSDIENETEKRKYVYNSVKDAKKKMLETLITNNVSEIWAYNCPFDKSSIKRLFGEDWEMINNLVTFYDIIPAILHTKLLTKKYVNFCNDNGYVTEKGNIQTKAEIVYRYLKNDKTFEEEHTGLSDCKIEYEILLTAIRTKKKIEKQSPPAWRILKQFCEANEIEIKIPVGE